MNIFFVDKNPIRAAEALCDKHINKMLLESCQMLSTAHRVLDGEPYYGYSKSGRKIQRWRLQEPYESILYQATHINHPCNIWVRESIVNYNWLLYHACTLLVEFIGRKAFHTGASIENISHKCEKVLKYIIAPPFNIPLSDSTKPALAMPEQFHSDDPVASYRRFYYADKYRFAKWEKGRACPFWFIKEKEQHVDSSV